jgi:predicted nucleic acid-binding protein
LSSLSVELVDQARLPELAWREFVPGCSLCVSPYDATYLATASITSCELWTADDRLVSTVGDDLPWVRSLSEIIDNE